MAKPTTQPNEAGKTTKRIINQMSQHDIEVEMAKTTHKPYMTYTLNGHQYIGTVDGTLIEKPRVFQTKTLYDIVKDTEKYIINDITDKVKQLRVTKEGKTYTRIEHWKYDKNGKSLYVNEHTKKDRPLSRMNIPGEYNLFPQKK